MPIPYKQERWYTPNMAFQWPSAVTNNTDSAERENVRLDQGCSYRGVRISTTCLTCPLQECKLDNIKWANVFIQKTVIIPKDADTTAWVKEYAVDHKYSERTIWRWLRNGKMVLCENE